jgi:hypothetical protein
LHTLYRDLDLRTELPSNSSISMPRQHRSCAVAGLRSFSRPAAFQTRVSPGPRDPPWIVGRQVAMVVHARWVMTYRRRGASSSADGQVVNEPPYPFKDLAAFAQGRWSSGFRDGQDLALLLLRAVVGTHAVAGAALVRRLSDLQLGFVRGLLPNRQEELSAAEYRAALIEVHWMIERIASEVLLLSRPGSAARHAWFPTGPQSAGIAQEIEQLLGRSESTVSGLRQQETAALALSSTTEAGQQLVLAGQAREASQRAEVRARQIDSVITAVATVLLGPGLVVGIYAALPAIFDGNESLRALSLVAAAIISALLIFFGLGVVRRRSGEDDHSSGSTEPR